MKTLTKRVPFGTGKFTPIERVSYDNDEEAFEITFSSGLRYLLPHAELRRANGLTEPTGSVDSIWIDAETRSGFVVRYSDGGQAEASWELVVEDPPA